MKETSLASELRARASTRRAAARRLWARFLDGLDAMPPWAGAAIAVLLYLAGYSSMTGDLP